MNFVLQLYYELLIMIELLVLTLSKYFTNKGSFIFCLIDSIYFIFDFNFFRIVNSSVGKYISIENVDEKKYDVALNFGSYDYIGFSNKIHERDKLLELYKKYNIAPNFEVTKKLESTINNFLNRESTSDTIIINGGYQGNSDYLPFILENYDYIISHHDNHASIIKGIKKSKESTIFYSTSDLENKLENIDLANNKVLVIIEGIYSMSGHISELQKYIDLKKRLPYHLYIDEAHSCGCIGSNQKGICDFYNIDPNSIEYLFGTFSKTFNAHGSYISGPKNIIKQLKIIRDNSNDNILPAVTCQYILSIYNYLKNNSSYINNKYSSLINYTYDKISKNKNFDVISTRGSPVICIRVFYGRARLISKYLIKNNIASVIVGHPAVKIPYSIVRICLSMSHTIDDIDYLISCLNLNADKTKLTLPKSESLKYYDENNITCEDLLENYGFGSAGPCGFFGYISLNLKLENLISTFTKKNTTIFMPNSNSGFSDIIENLIKRYKYKYICVNQLYNNGVYNLINKNKFCNLIEESEICNYNPKKILCIDFKMDNIDSLKVLHKIDNIEDYTFIAGKLSELCNGIGAFLSYNESQYGKIQKRTIHSSYVFSANLPAYIINHNIKNIRNNLKLKNN
jgi:serine palmitoyltransferase